MDTFFLWRNWFLTNKHVCKPLVWILLNEKKRVFIVLKKVFFPHAYSYLLKKLNSYLLWWHMWPAINRKYYMKKNMEHLANLMESISVLPKRNGNIFGVENTKILLSIFQGVFSFFVLFMKGGRFNLIYAGKNYLIGHSLENNFMIWYE